MIYELVQRVAAQSDGGQKLPPVVETLFEGQNRKITLD